VGDPERRLAARDDRPAAELYPAWIEVRVQGEKGTRRALAFTANPESPNYAGALPLEEVAACLAQACGHWGTGAEYLLQTVAALEREGFHDPALWALQERVAEIIEAGASEVGAPR
jgi:cation transport protein ChaC